MVPRRKKRWGDRFREQVEPKQLVTLAVALSTVLGVRHEAGVNAGRADERVTATASLAMVANQRADSIEFRLRGLERHVRALERKRRLAAGDSLPLYGPAEAPPGYHRRGLLSRLWGVLRRA